jgi:HEAT repeat protein
VPWLLKCLEYKRSPWKNKACATLSRLSGWRVARFVSDKLSWGDQEIDLHGCAMLGFAMLGAEASPSVRELLLLAEDPEQSRAYRALSAMSSLGNDGLLALVRVAGNQDSPNQVIAIKVFASLRHLGTNASPAIPVLARCARNSDREIAREAIYALCNLGLEPEISFSAFTNALASTNTNLRVSTIHHLGYFGRAAVLRPLVPSLLNCLHDPDGYVQTKAIEALTDIAPETTLRSPDVHTKRLALQHLALVGTGLLENEITPHVRACLTDSDEEVRSAATNALRQVTIDAERKAAHN